MAFPADPLDVLVELLIDDVWTDITADVLVRAGISLTRGQKDEGSRADVSKCALTINNANGVYSPRNPTSPYYGLIGRNTQIRVSAEGVVRFVGEVSSWPPRWDITGADVWVPVEASGITRRLGQGAAPLRSALYRGLTNPALTNPPVAYWPCEDVEGATSFASGIGGPSMTFTGDPDLGSYRGFAASAPLPLLNDSVWTGVVPAYVPTGAATIRFLMFVPDTGIEGDEALVTVYTSGSAAQWVIRYGDPGGALKVQAYDEDGNVIMDSGFVTFDVNGRRLRVALDLEQVGGDIKWDISTVFPGASSGLTFGNFLAGETLGQVQRVLVSVGGGITDTAIGHISVQPQVESIFALGPQVGGYVGETAGRRIERLCAEQQIPFTFVGDLDDTVRMGAQTPDSLLNLIGEAADTDLGILYEPRHAFGLAYRTRTSMHNQSAAAELDYSAGHLVPPLEPVDDDQAVRNDVTATRKDGSSARAVVESGPMSTAAPPAGVGRYDEDVTVNVETDNGLPDQAHWRAHLGTVDETRFPTIAVDLTVAALVDDLGLTAALTDLDVGDRLTVDNPPPWLPPDPISQIVVGFTEHLDAYGWRFTYNCVPERPFQVAVYGTARYGTEHATLAEDVTNSATSLEVATSAGPLWTTADGDMPIDIVIGGERMTVTAISGASSPQTFTVVRSVNGVVKPHTAGAEVRFASPAVRAL
ncbi:hypothetical protein E1295_31850 [Nonomuraea mesophila]|uniref:Uncharacterized protein n=1 Tax=Nonomuraea mesophila TaxID=2530382 RepID=A0A4R5EZD2_9ACTN|nr:hypothetical protein [Nonomuraea mesophila]TDE40495.1 hypothetical protein E1295_31850 [Nonomuraea mesophila]